MLALWHRRSRGLGERLDHVERTEKAVQQFADLAKFVTGEVKAQGLGQLLQFASGRSSNRHRGPPRATR